MFGFVGLDWGCLLFYLESEGDNNFTGREVILDDRGVGRVVGFRLL